MMSRLESLAFKPLLEIRLLTGQAAGVTGFCATPPLDSWWKLLLAHVGTSSSAGGKCVKEKDKVSKDQQSTILLEQKGEKQLDGRGENKKPCFGCIRKLFGIFDVVKAIGKEEEHLGVRGLCKSRWVSLFVNHPTPFFPASSKCQTVVPISRSRKTVLAFINQAFSVIISKKDVHNRQLKKKSDKR